MGGFCGAYAAVLGLLVRQRTGVGQMVEASLLGGAIQIVRLWLQRYLMSGKVMTGSAFNNVGRPLWNLYQCQDEKWLVISVSEADKYWHQFCEVLEIQELEKDSKFENADARRVHISEILPRVREILCTKTRNEWLDIFRKAGINAAPVNEMVDLIADPQARAMNYIVDFDDPDYGKVTRQLSNDMVVDG